MKIKTSELIGPALDWAVAKCEYDELAALNIQFPDHAKHYPKVSPSTDWSQGGSIMDREDIDSFVVKEAGVTESGAEVLRKIGWKAWISPSAYWMSKRFISEGETRLIAAMRCFVASKLGEEVEVPDELT